MTFYNPSFQSLSSLKQLGSQLQSNFQIPKFITKHRPYKEPSALRNRKRKALINSRMICSIMGVRSEPVNISNSNRPSSVEFDETINKKALRTVQIQ